MPLFDVCRKLYLIEADSATDAVNIASQRWNLAPELLAAYLHVENKQTEEALALSDLLKRDTETVLKAWNYLVSVNDIENAVKLQGVSEHLHMAQVKLSQYADNVDRQVRQRRHAQLEAQTTRAIIPLDNPST